ncbi:MAG: hypothetical protein QTN59_12920 [Candidatus Electrothrix communis]|nr:MAG: hypothetical protein QTN59_12920 [Candidatus Electrothrix communis]
MKVGVIIQARMGSTRLPGKVLRLIAGRPLLDHVLDRLQSLERPVQIIVATSDMERDDSIVNHCHLRKTQCFRGSESDVLGRYYDCARKYCFDHVVRLTADNPFTDIVELDRLMVLHLAEGNDYTHSFDMMPLGVGAEIFTYASLKRSFVEGLAENHREHVNEYIQENPAIFKTGQLAVDSAKISSDLRLTVDTLDDYHRACHLAEHVMGRWISTEEAIKLCSPSV